MIHPPRKIAIIHDWLAIYTGSERVVEQLLLLYPHADLFSLVNFLPPDQSAFIQGKPVQVSFLQRFPFARKHFRNYLAFMPFAIEQFDLSPYDLVISSSHAISKGVITGPDTLHLSYIHSPIRYAWDMQHEYLRESRLTRGVLGPLVRLMLHYIRLWDTRTMNGVDAAVANSQFIARRIWKIYRRSAQVIYPPVDVQRFTCFEQKDNYYLAASRMVPYKKMDLIVRAFNAMPDLRLTVIGDGPELKRVRELAGPNVTVLGYQPTGELVKSMQRARAFVFAAQEDFGIIPIEAQACGTPVIAFGKGGASETIRGLDHPQPSGLFFEEQTAEAIQEAVRRFESLPAPIDPHACRANAERFSPDIFRASFSAFVEEEWARFKQAEVK